MKKYLLTTHNDQKVVVNEEMTHRAQDLYVDEALADGLTLKEMLELDGFLNDWVPLEGAEYETDWGATIDSCESDAEFTAIEE